MHSSNLPTRYFKEPSHTPHSRMYSDHNPKNRYSPKKGRLKTHLKLQPDCHSTSRRESSRSSWFVIPFPGCRHTWTDNKDYSRYTSNITYARGSMSEALIDRRIRTSDPPLALHQPEQYRDYNCHSCSFGHNMNIGRLIVQLYEMVFRIHYQIKGTQLQPPVLKKAILRNSN